MIAVESLPFMALRLWHSVLKCEVCAVMCKLDAILEYLMRKILKRSPSIMLIDVMFISAE